MSIVMLLFLLTAAVYFVSGGLFFLYLLGGSSRFASLAARALALSVGLHVVFLVADYYRAGRTPLATMHELLAVLSLLIALGFLATMRRHRLPVLGAFITPVTLLLFLAAALRGPVPPVPEGVRSALLPLHITVNVLGIAAFALAFAVAVAYLIQEKLLRTRQVGGVFQRLPALDVLDSLGFRLVTVSFSTAQGFAILAWLFFASVLLSRAAGGWRGRRAAIGTMLGFLCAMAAIGGYVLKSAGG
jgi:ABC-type uncharacterized transport system permease subunit